jgi:SAM-dependent methyltransferase
MNESVPHFYSRPGLHVEIYDIQTRAGYTPEDVDFYREIAESTGGPVLELGCGTGRIAIPLLETGLEIHGLDASSAMLNVTRKKRGDLPAEKSARLHLHWDDMMQFNLSRKFAFIYIAFRSIQILLTPEDQRRCLRCVREHLAPNGRVVINLFDPRYDKMGEGRMEPFIGPREFVHPVSGNRVVVETLERICEPVSQTFEERWRFTETNAAGAVVREEIECLRLRWTFRYEMRHLLESCGFAIEAEYSDFHRSPPAYGKEQVWVLKAV